jgi:hypothetical protein
MKRNWVGLSLSFLLGAALMLAVQSLVKHAEAVSPPPATNRPKRLFVPFMHMRNIGAKAGHNDKPGQDRYDAGSEIEIWNTDDTRPLTITEIYFTTPDGKTQLEGSKYGLPLPLQLNPHTHYHFNSFYEHLTLPVPPIPDQRKNFVHGYLAEIRWKGPTPHVRGWDLGVKNGQYYMSMPIAVFEE